MLQCARWDAVATIVDFKEKRGLVSAHSSMDEVVHAAWGHLRTGALGGAGRLVATWTLFFVVALTHLFWVRMWAIAAGGAISRGEPLGETLVILGMGPPITAGLWPLSGLLGGWCQVPFVPVLHWWVER